MISNNNLEYKSRKVTLFLAIFLFIFAANRYYLKQNVSANSKLFTNCLVIVWLCLWVLYSNGSFSIFLIILWGNFAAAIIWDLFDIVEIFFLKHNSFQNIILLNWDKSKFNAN